MKLVRSEYWESYVFGFMVVVELCCPSYCWLHTEQCTLK
jgi:hypothetical protein